jgi:hypothetical protein
MGTSKNITPRPETAAGFFRGAGLIGVHLKANTFYRRAQGPGRSETVGAVIYPHSGVAFSLSRRAPPPGPRAPRYSLLF